MRLVFGLAICVAAFAEPRRLRFEDHPVETKKILRRAPVRLVTSFDREFRTRITDAAKEAPNFAGRYRIEIWGCGSGCANGALLDLESGSVYRLPLDYRSDGWLEGCNMLGPDLGFRLDSRLFVVTCASFAHYFVWNGERFTPLARVRQ
jgi:hypothetical protein